MDKEQEEAFEWSKEEALAMFEASEPVSTRKRPRDSNKIAVSIVQDASKEVDERRDD